MGKSLFRVGPTGDPLSGSAGAAETTRHGLSYLRRLFGSRAQPDLTHFGQQKRAAHKSRHHLSRRKIKVYAHVLALHWSVRSKACFHFSHNNEAVIFEMYRRLCVGVSEFRVILCGVLHILGIVGECEILNESMMYNMI